MIGSYFGGSPFELFFESIQPEIEWQIFRKETEMAQIKVVQDLDNKTLMVFFGDPGGEVHSDAIDETTVIFRNDDGEIIGVEKLEYDTGGTVVDVSVETHSATSLPEG